jgi:hypothetical protein
MKKLYAVWLIVILSAPFAGRGSETIKLSEQQYRDKLAGGFVGQMAGVTFAAPYEFRADGERIPESVVHQWQPEMIKGALIQDDIYVELTFLATIEKYGIDVSQEQIGKDFGASKYPLWHANKAGRDNIRKGVMPPLSGHPRYNPHADDIDYQIESDMFGLVSPGMPKAVQEFGWRFGHVMNYGDGVYGGVFISAMYAAAFFESDRVKIVESGLAAIPPESNYAKTIRDVLSAHQKNPNDWRYAWRVVEKNWAGKVHCPDPNPLYFWRKLGIGANVNGAYVVIAFLYGGGDPYKTMRIATMCGRDADCNSSSAMGILGTMIGFERLPADFKSSLPAMKGKKFAYTNYDWEGAVAALLRTAQKVLVKQGGRVDQETWMIPAQTPNSLPLEQWPYDIKAQDVPLPSGNK